MGLGGPYWFITGVFSVDELKSGMSTHLNKSIDTISNVQIFYASLKEGKRKLHANFQIPS